MNRVPSAYRGYLVAVVAMCMAVLIRRYLLPSLFSDQVPVGLFLMAVIAAAWVGGFKAGLLAVALGAVGVVYTFAGIDDVEPPTLVTRVQSAVFVGGGLLTTYFTVLLHKTKLRLEDRQRELESRQTQLAAEVEHRRVVEAALGKREERIRMAVESADIGTWDLNVATGRREWSVRAKEMFGLPPDADPTTLDFLALLHPDDRQHVGRAIRAALDPRANGSYHVDYRVLRADGTIRWVVAKGQAFFQGEGEARAAQRFIGTVFDITERKDMEQALQEADRRKNEFLAMLAHELRNPLTPLRNALEIWPTIEQEPEEMAALRGMMSRQVQQMIRLIDDLLDVARMTRGKIELRVEPVDLQAVIGLRRRNGPPRDRQLRASAVGVGRRAAADSRRRGPADASVQQHPAQRGEIHRPRGLDRADRPAAGRPGRGDGQRRWRGYRAAHAGGNLRAVSPRRFDVEPLARRTGHRADAGQANRRDARRHDRSQ